MASEVKPHIVFVMGPPGAGKGTMCQKLKDEFGFAHYSAGDCLREEAKTGSDRGKEIASLMAEGKIVPAEYAVELLKRKIDVHKNTVRCFLIDGFPRNHSQGDLFRRLICECDFLLDLHCPEQLLLERMKKRAQQSTEKRADDNEETFAKRLRTHNEVCEPVLADYRRRGLLKQVDASRPVDEVYKEVRALFLPFLS